MLLCAVCEIVLLDGLIIFDTSSCGRWDSIDADVKTRFDSIKQEHVIGELWRIGDVVGSNSDLPFAAIFLLQFFLDENSNVSVVAVSF